MTVVVIFLVKGSILFRFILYIGMYIYISLNF